MNILTVAPHGLYQDYSASFVHNQAKAYVQQGHRVRAVIPLAFGKRNDEGKRFGKIVDIRNVDGVEVCYVRCLSLGGFGANGFNQKSARRAVKLLMRNILKDFSADVVHGHTLNVGSELGSIFKKAFACPLVLTTHGGDTNLPYEKGQYELLKGYCDCADVVIAVSEKLKARLESCHTETPVRVIYNGFSVHPDPDSCERDHKALIQVGNLIPSKRFDVTIRALAKLREEGLDLTLTVIGQGPLRSELEALSAQLGISEFVHFLGRKPNAEVFQKMCESGIFVMASKPEGFGIVYLEAMAAGCVTVGTEGEGIDGVIENGRNGFLVPADDEDAIVRVVKNVVNDPQLASAVAMRGKETAQNMTWEQNVCQYEELFGSLQKEHK